MKPIVVRTSERRDLKRCPAKWWWRWREGITPNRIDNKLWFGAGIHVALAEWYQEGLERGKDPVQTWFDWVKDEEVFIRNNNVMIDQEEWVNARDLGASMLDEYVILYGRDEQWSFISTEQTFEVKIPVPAAPNGYITYVGTFDGVYRDLTNNALWLAEHKTAATLPNIGYLELDDQAGSYFTVAETVLRHKGLIGENEFLEGIMYNFLRKALPDDRPKNAMGQALNKDGTVSKRQGTPLFMRHPVWRSVNQRAKMVQNIINETDLMIKYRTKELQITKTPTMNCQWDCEFFAMCQLHEAGEDWKEFRDAMFKRRDPYGDHRLAIKSAGND